MSCSTCTKSVEGALMSVQCVISGRVNLFADLTFVTHNAVLAHPSDMAEAITYAGFKAYTFDRNVRAVCRH